MSKQTIAEKALEIRNETKQYGNTRGRVADVLDDINETKADKVDLDEAVSGGLIPLQESLNQEIANRAAADQSEAQARANSDQNLQNQITTNAGNISTEIQNRTNADANLQGQITTNANAVSAEQTARIAEDAKKIDKPATTVTAPDATYKYVPLLDTNGKSTQMLAGDLGKNIANSDLTTTAARTLTQAYNYTWNTGGYYFYFKGLPDKSSDATFTRMRVQDSNGQEAWGNGAKVLLNASNLLTDAEIDTLRVNLLKSTEAFSTGQPVISSVNPPIILQKPGYTQYVSIIGSQLYIDSQSTQAQVKIVASDGTEILVNNFTTAQNNPNILTFPITDGQLQNGDYTFKIYNNGVWSAINTNAKLRVRSNVNQLSLPNLTWSVKDYAGNVPPDYTGSIPNGGFAKQTSSTSVQLFNKSPNSVAQTLWAQSNEPLITPQMMSNGVLLIIDFNLALSVSDFWGYIGLTNNPNLTTANDYTFGVQINPYSKFKITPINTEKTTTSSSTSPTDQLFIIINSGQITIVVKSYGVVATQSIDISKNLYLKVSPSLISGNTDHYSNIKAALNSIYQLN